MTAVLRSELYRTLTIRSSWVSMGTSAAVGLAFGWFSGDFWALFTGLGTYAVAVVIASQHYQHRTAVLLFLGEPRRLRALAAQCVVAVLITVALAAVSGLSQFTSGEGDRYLTTLVVVPLVALFGVATATVVRKPIWLLGGFAGWVIFVEGMLGKLESPLPFSSFLEASTGDNLDLLIFGLWTAAALLVAAWSIRRDLSGD
jgi:ABC-2 type transport system ATP-binding protein